MAVSSPDPNGDTFVAVEFDDGDSGRIAIEDIRFLEPNYPVVGECVFVFLYFSNINKIKFDLIFNKNIYCSYQICIVKLTFLICF